MRRLLIVTIVAVLLLSGAALASGQIAFRGAAGGAAVRPATLYLTGDSTLEVDQISWQKWGGPSALGHGIAEYHGCTPNCAAAPVHHSPVVVGLSQIATCHGRQYYTKVTLVEPNGDHLDARFTGQTNYKPC